MRLETIFARNDDLRQGGVLVVNYSEGDGPNAWDELTDRLNDVEYLNRFFDSRTRELRQQKPGTLTIEAAIDRARDELQDMALFMLELATAKNEDETYDKLKEIFRPLNNQLYRPVDLSQEKTRGRQHNGWLRVYAVRVSPDVYIITGGAIKIWQMMDDDETTRIELRNLNRVTNWLREEGIIDAASLEGLEGL